MPWYKVTMTAAQVTNQEHVALQSKFTRVFMASNAPQEAALYSARLADQNGLDIYFSPKAADIAASLITFYGGHECTLPSDKKPNFLMGHNDARHRLLSE
ncbi:MAG: hypothetical protein OEU36_11220 [Gammaproteobacteria bacterium]|nr:hypothetical protein [Gammaproteobacteria bacterium]